jgi:2-methylisocitrate lyase-like PEP mutase family enzyme
MNLNSINASNSAASATRHPLFISKEELAGFSSVLNSAINQSQGQTSTGYDAIFAAAAQKYNVPENLLKAVAKVESNYHANATSRCGAMGIMQLMPRTAAWLGVKDAYDPEQNIMGGAKYLNMLLKKYDGDVELTLAAYNAGPGTVHKHGNTVPSFAQGYVNKVLRNVIGEFSTASYGSSGTQAVSSGNGIAQAMAASVAEAPVETQDAGGESLPTLLMLKITAEMKLLEALDADREPGNVIFQSKK